MQQSHRLECTKLFCANWKTCSSHGSL